MSLSPYYEGAPEWYIRAAREALQPLPNWLTMPSPGHSAEVLHDHEHGQVNIAVAIDTGRTQYYDRPRPGAAREQWTKARIDVAERLEQAGFTVTRLTLAGFKATAPEPDPNDTPTVELVRSPVLGEVGRYTAHIAGHPELVGDIDAHFEVMHSNGYTLTSPKNTTVGRYPTEHDAAHAWALHCGFPPPTIVTR
ncbi:hypothetical protein [Nocardiopsis sp. FR4]|uniref:hypothetical protein n=1 Tax=Nocardiopsis sp. FR4 TaxID=2605985 RepID=UPI00135808E2|nr:hypothetical protein [Nocardiopsis sp. FR4]